MGKSENLMSFLPILFLNKIIIFMKMEGRSEVQDLGLFLEIKTVQKLKLKEVSLACSGHHPKM